MKTALLTLAFLSPWLAIGAEPAQPNATPLTFDSMAALHQWATTSTFGSGRTYELDYKGRKVFVAFLCHTSGLPTSEPFVFLEESGRWVRILKAAIANTEMEATIEGDALILWSLTWPAGKRIQTEALRFELKHLK